MKNHFIISYSGNKREEVEIIYNNIKNYIDDKKIIIEPYCGTSAISYYISLKQPKKYKYILNDHNKYLMDLYKIMKDEEALKNFIDEINKRCWEDDEFINKETYLKIINENDVYGWFIKNKYYNRLPGLYPPPNKRQKKKFNIDDINKINIINFLRTEDVEFKDVEAIEIFKKYKNNEDVFFIFDPPYLIACNDFYSVEHNKRTNIYEYFYYNSSNNKNVCFVLEENWMTLLLFQKYKQIKYEKKYNGYSKKRVNHIIFINDY